MKRWNGWGDQGRQTELPPAAAGLLADLAGEGQPRAGRSFPADAFQSSVHTFCRIIPLFSTLPEERIHYAHGQSLPDWIDLRFGNPGPLSGRRSPPHR